MKTRNCKLSLLVIFLTLCFAIYSGNCYSQGFDLLGPSYTWNQMDIGYPFGIGYSYLDSFNYSWNCIFCFWRQPGGKATLDLLLDTVPNLNITYEDFYGIEYEPYKLDLESDYYYYNRFQSPIMDNLNVYQNPEIYALPLSQINTLYNFTKGFLVQPMQPDIWVGYGAIGMGAMGNY